jgi:hypothetical protein
MISTVYEEIQNTLHGSRRYRPGPLTELMTYQVPAA